MIEQAVDERRLGLDQLFAGPIGIEPLGAIDLRELPLVPGARRPLEAEGLAVSAAGSKSPSTAQAWTTLPPFCRTDPSSTISSGSPRARARAPPHLAQRAGAQILFLLGTRPWVSTRRRGRAAPRTGRRDGPAALRGRLRRGRGGLRRLPSAYGRSTQDSHRRIRSGRPRAAGPGIASSPPAPEPSAPGRAGRTRRSARRGGTQPRRRPRGRSPSRGWRSPSSSPPP